MLVTLASALFAGICASSLEPIRTRDLMKNWKNTKNIFTINVFLKKKVYCRVKISEVISFVGETIRSEL